MRKCWSLNVNPLAFLVFNFTAEKGVRSWQTIPQEYNNFKKLYSKFSLVDLRKKQFCIYRASGVMKSGLESNVTRPLCALSSSFLFIGQAGCVHVKTCKSLLSLQNCWSPPAPDTVNKQRIVMNTNSMLMITKLT